MYDGQLTIIFRLYEQLRCIKRKTKYTSHIKNNAQAWSGRWNEVWNKWKAKSEDKTKTTSTVIIGWLTRVFNGMWFEYVAHF